MEGETGGEKQGARHRPLSILNTLITAEITHIGPGNQTASVIYTLAPQVERSRSLCV